MGQEQCDVCYSLFHEAVGKNGARKFGESRINSGDLFPVILLHSLVLRKLIKNNNLPKVLWE